MHETWTDLDSGYKCKIVQFGDSRFKAIALSPNGKHEIAFERRNRHIAKRELISAIQAVKEEIVNKKPGKSPRAKKRKERKLRAQKRNAENQNDKCETGHNNPVDVKQAADACRLNNPERTTLTSRSAQKKLEAKPEINLTHTICQKNFFEPTTIDQNLLLLDLRNTISEKTELYVPIWNSISCENIIAFELRGNHYHGKPTSNTIVLSPEPSNYYDKNAIRVLDSNYKMIGYVPKEIAASKKEYDSLTKYLKTAWLEFRNNRYYVNAHIKKLTANTIQEDINKKSIRNSLRINKNSEYVFSDQSSGIFLDKSGLLFTKDDQGLEVFTAIPEVSLNYFFNHCKNLTDEQKSVVLLTCAGKSFKVNAFAGTGKTTTILNAARAYSFNKQSYLAFNSAIAKEVRELKIFGLQAYTVHQYARLALIRKDVRYAGKLNNPGIDYRTDLNFLESACRALNLGRREILICLSIISDFSRTDSDRFSTTPKMDNEIKKWLIDDFIPKDKMKPQNLFILRVIFEKTKYFFINKSIRLFNYIVDPATSTTALSFEIYLKIWQLYPIHFDECIFFVDEAQDIDPVMFSALQKIRKQTVWVGDSYQQIYRWRGAVNAMDQISGQALYLTQTFRFNQEICDLANFCLKKLGESRKIITSKKGGFLVNDDPRKTVLFRTNVRMIESAFINASYGKKLFFPALNKNDHFKILEFYCLNLIAFRNKEIAKGKKLEKYKNFSDLESSINSDDVDQDLTQAYRICELFCWNRLSINSNFRKLQFALCDSSSVADLVMCTAHSAKGREWEFTEIADDFEHFLLTSKSVDEQLFKDELMLFYVAITRAKKAITNARDVEEVLSRIFRCSVDSLKKQT